MSPSSGRARGASRERGTAAIANAESPALIVAPSSFTPINSSPGLLTSRLPPQLPATPSVQERHRNAAVARYLGLGAAREPGHLEGYAPALPPTPESPPVTANRKRKRNTQRHVCQATTPTTKLPPKRAAELEQCVSDRLCVTTNAPAHAQRPQVSIGDDHLPPFPSAQAQLDHRDHRDRLDCPDNQSCPTLPCETLGLTAGGYFEPAKSSCQNIITAADKGQDDATKDEGNNGNSFDDGLDDSDFWMLDVEPSELSSPFRTMPAAQTSTSAPTLPSGSTRHHRNFVSPVTPNAKVLRTQRTVSMSEEIRKPITRSSFPKPVRDRSPIIGLTSEALLRTCFRVGEAINQGSRAAKQGQDVFLELYARIRSSERTETKQHFVFCDLFHERPPYLSAVYEAAIWRPVELFNYDSGRLLQERRACRCIGKLKRTGSGWTMVVFNIWETTWEDITWVEGIINS